MNNLGSIKSRGGSLSPLSVVKEGGGGEGGGGVRKDKHCYFPLWCVIFCDNVILTRLIIESSKVVYGISSTEVHKLALQKYEGNFTLCESYFSSSPKLNTYS